MADLSKIPPTLVVRDGRRSTLDSMVFAQNNVHRVGRVLAIEADAEGETRVIGADGVLVLSGMRFGEVGEAARGLVWLLRELGFPFNPGDVWEPVRHKNETRMWCKYGG